MSFIRDPRTAENIDLHGAGDLLAHVNITPDQVAAARATLARHDASDLADMLGIREESA